MTKRRGGSAINPTRARPVKGGTVTFIFFKEDVAKKRSADDLDVELDCDCPDYKYRWAYANHAYGAGKMGKEAMNKSNGKAPKKTNPSGKPGLCKHLASVSKYPANENGRKQRHVLGSSLKSSKVSRTKKSFSLSTKRKRRRANATKSWWTKRLSSRPSPSAFTFTLT
jgi:hypothetical protein